MYFLGVSKIFTILVVHEHLSLPRRQNECLAIEGVAWNSWTIPVAIVLPIIVYITFERSLLLSAVVPLIKLIGASKETCNSALEIASFLYTDNKIEEGEILYRRLVYCKRIVEK